MPKMRSLTQEYVMAILIGVPMYFFVAMFAHLPPFTEKIRLPDRSQFSTENTGLVYRPDPLPFETPSDKRLIPIYAEIIAKDSTPQSIAKVQQSVGLELLNAVEREFVNECRENTRFPYHVVLCVRGKAQASSIFKLLLAGVSVLAIISVLLPLFRKKD